MTSINSINKSFFDPVIGASFYHPYEEEEDAFLGLKFFNISNRDTTLEMLETLILTKKSFQERHVLLLDTHTHCPIEGIIKIKKIEQYRLHYQLCVKQEEVGELELYFPRCPKHIWIEWIRNYSKPHQDEAVTIQKVSNVSQPFVRLAFELSEAAGLKGKIRFDACYNSHAIHTMNGFVPILDTYKYENLHLIHEALQSLKTDLEDPDFLPAPISDEFKVLEEAKTILSKEFNLPISKITNDFILQYWWWDRPLPMAINNEITHEIMKSKKEKTRINTAHLGDVTMHFSCSSKEKMREGIKKNCFPDFTSELPKRRRLIS